MCDRSTPVDRLTHGWSVGWLVGVRHLCFNCCERGAEKQPKRSKSTVLLLETQICAFNQRNQNGRWLLRLLSLTPQTAAAAQTHTLVVH